jgi:serpin B
MRPSSLAARLLLAVTVLLLPACDSAGPEPDPAPPTIELTAAEQKVLDASGRDFGLALFRTLNEHKENGQNVLLSPLSVSTALTMTMNGADDSTLSVMKRVMGVDAYSLGEINSAHQRLLSTLPQLDDRATLLSAQSMWVQEGYPVEPAFSDTLRSVFDADTATVDFASQQAVERVNQWVAENTDGMIQMLVDDGDFDRSTVLALLNALYFEAPWQEAFDEAKTETAPFTRPDGSTVQVSLMQRTDSLRYFSAEQATGVDLSYGNGAFRMTVIVPRSGTRAHALATSLDAATWRRWLDDATRRTVVVHLPRFTVESPSSLNAPLQDLGMGIAFSQAADFSGISPQNPFVESVLHKAAVSVSEQGTEASAATAIVFGESGRPTVRADRPFLFAIREAQTGTLLFLGRVDDPTA